MGPSLGLFALFTLFHLSSASFKTLFVNPDTEPCDPDQLCVIFGNDQCEVDGAMQGGDIYGMVWVDGPSSKCADPHVGHIYARLDFNFSVPTEWRMNVTTWESILKIQFKFAEADLSFDDAKTAKLTLRKGGSAEAIEMTELDSISRPIGRYNLHVYQFVLKTANQQKLNDLVGGTVVYYDETRGEVQLSDSQFAARLGGKSKCYISELRTTCYQACEKMISEDPVGPDETKPASTFCPHTIWIHNLNGDKTRWGRVESLQCVQGKWHGEWDNKKNQPMGGNVEIQCSAEKPALPKVSSTVIYAAVGISVLVVAVVVGGVVFWRCSKRNAHINAYNNHGYGPSSKNAGTPGGDSNTHKEGTQKEIMDGANSPNV